MLSKYYYAPKMVADYNETPLPPWPKRDVHEESSEDSNMAPRASYNDALPPPPPLEDMPITGHTVTTLTAPFGNEKMPPYSQEIDAQQNELVQPQKRGKLPPPFSIDERGTYRDFELPDLAKNMPGGEERAARLFVEEQKRYGQLMDSDLLMRKSANTLPNMQDVYEKNDANLIYNFLGQASKNVANIGNFQGKASNTNMPEAMKLLTEANEKTLARQQNIGSNYSDLAKTQAQINNYEEINTGRKNAADLDPRLLDYSTTDGKQYGDMLAKQYKSLTGQDIEPSVAAKFLGKSSNILTQAYTQMRGQDKKYEIAKGQLEETSLKNKLIGAKTVGDIKKIMSEIQNDEDKLNLEREKFQQNNLDNANALNLKGRQLDLNQEIARQNKENSVSKIGLAAGQLEILRDKIKNGKSSAAERLAWDKDKFSRQEKQRQKEMAAKPLGKPPSVQVVDNYTQVMRTKTSALKLKQLLANDAIWIPLATFDNRTVEVNKLLAQVTKELSGAAFSEQERKMYMGMLPNWQRNLVNKKSNMVILEDMIAQLGHKHVMYEKNFPTLDTAEYNNVKSNNLRGTKPKQPPVWTPPAKGR